MAELRMLPAGPAATVDPDAARRSAQEILDGSKYQEPQFPRPFKGILEWLADRIRPVTDAIDSVLERVVGFILDLPGGRFILAALIVAVLVLVIRWLAGRRSRSAVSSTASSGLVDLRLDPDALEREAHAAEADGDHALAVRRRYEAGLLRLVRSDRLVLRADTTAGAAARQVDQPAMDELTADFEQIVYGGRDAGPVDSERSQALWAEVLGAVVRR